MSEGQLQVKLSASKIKTLQSCSWLYYAQYVLKVPQKRNDGASRGVCVHSILDCLLKPRHKKYVEFILKQHKFPSSVQRLLKNLAVKYGVNKQEHMEMMQEMIVVALQNDFFCAGSEKILSEHEFRISTSKYLIVGYIDKLSFSVKGLKIYDYKTSKVKFNQEELESNIQALIYSLACYKKYGKIPAVEFQFLRFPRQPIQQLEPCTKRQLEGFELFLEQLSDYLDKFKPETAISDLAANSKKRQWLCGKEGCKLDGTPHFICQYRKPTEYYALITNDSKIVATSFKKSDLTSSQGQKVIKVHYDGCPHYKHEQFEDDDPFDLD